MFQALPGISAGAPGAMDQMAQMMPRPKKTGMFGSGKGNIGEIIAAALSGALAARGNPAGQMGLQMLHQRRQQQMQEQQHQQRRGEDFEDWVKKQAYQAANPNPVNNDTVADYGFIESILGKDEAANFLRNKANPPQLMNIPGVGIVQIPRMGGQGMPSAPVGKLTPIDEGGPAPQGPGGFPRPRQY